MRLAWIVVLMSSRVVFADNATLPGTLTVDPPTLEALGVAWTLTGDDNRNATVSVRYRPVGQSTWKSALPLFRPENRTFVWANFNTPGNLFAGSIFDLQPGTEYELELTLVDPDGGGTTRTVTAKTRPVPSASSSGRMRYVSPGTSGGTGTEADPFRGLAAAAVAAQPGDVFILKAGTYAAGHVRFTADGTVDAPIVFRGAERDGVVFDATGLTDWVFDFSQRKFNFLESITLVHAKKALRATGATGMVVRDTVMKDFVVGTTTDKTWGLLVDENHDGYYCDNQLLGPEPNLDRDRAGYAPSYNFEMSGTGNVICNNLLTHWWDAITSSDVCYASPICYANDITGNLILYATDDGVELDGSLRNVRLLRNRIGSSFDGISVQPAYGGPVYVIRNEVFSSQRSPLKLNPASTVQDGPSGVVVLHNSMANYDRGIHGGTWSNALFRNNLLYATSSYAVNDTVMNETGKGFDFDYDSVHFTGPYAFNFSFRGAASTVTVRYSLADLCTMTGNECHGSAFASLGAQWVNVPEPSSVTGAATPAFAADAWDFTLAANASAIDSAVVLPNVNDGFVGNAPDRGALERGAPQVHYGPRVGGMPPSGPGGGAGGGGGASGTGGGGEPSGGGGEISGAGGGGEAPGGAGGGVGDIGHAQPVDALPGCHCSVVDPSFALALLLALRARARRAVSGQVSLRRATGRSQTGADGRGPCELSDA